jgi:hypothetical protein
MGFAGYLCPTAVPGEPATDISVRNAIKPKRDLDSLGMHYLSRIRVIARHARYPLPTRQAVMISI